METDTKSKQLMTAKVFNIKKKTSFIYAKTILTFKLRRSRGTQINALQQTFVERAAKKRKLPDIFTN